MNKKQKQQVIATQQKIEKLQGIITNSISDMYLLTSYLIDNDINLDNFNNDIYNALDIISDAIKKLTININKKIK